jgi:RNA polymerase sigma factor (sigma-70 family)
MGSELTAVLAYLRHATDAPEGDEGSDARLLQRFVAHRDEAAFAALLERHGGLVLGVCRQVLGDAHDAEDAFQAPFLVLARKAASIRSGELLPAWLHRVACNIARTAGTCAGQRRAHERQAALLSQARPAEVALRDWQPILHEEVGRLPQKYRVPVLLCYFEGKTHPEAARALGWPVGTVKGRLARARDLLRGRLARRGLALTGAGLATTLAESADAAVPPALLGPTLQAAVSFAAGGAGTGVVASARAVALAKGALQSMSTTKPLYAIALMLALGAITCALVAGAPSAGPRGGPSPPLPKQGDARPPGTDLHGDPLPPGARARLGTVRFRTSSTWLGFTPGDKALLTAGAGWLSAWDVATGKELRRCRCPEHSRALALAPDGKTLAVATDTDDPKSVAIYLRDTSTGRALQELRGHRALIRSLVFAADGRTLVSGSHDKTVRFWDVARGKEVRRFDEPDMVLAIALSPDGKTLATGSFHSTNSKWTVRFRDAATGREQRRFQTDRFVFHLAFSPDGKTLVALAPDNGGQPTSTIYLWDVVTGTLRNLGGQPAFLYTAAFSPDSKTLATSSDGGIVLWDVATFKERGRPGGQYASGPSVTFSGDGKLLAWVGNGTIRLWDVVAGKERRARAEGHQSAVEAVVFLPDGKTLASASGDRTLRLWEAATGRPVRQYALPGALGSRGWFAPDGSALAWGDGRRIAQVDVVTGKPLRSFDFPDVLYHFAVPPDGKFLAAFGRDEVLRLVDRATGKVVRELRKDADRAARFALAPDGRTLALGDYEHDTIRLVDVTTGEERALLRFPKRPWVFVFSPDGKTLTVALAGDRLALMEVATGKERLALRVREHVARIVYSPDGKRLAVGTRDGTIHLWELATGKEVRRLAGHQGAVSCLSFSADGRRLASGSEDTTVLVWDVLKGDGERPSAAKLSAEQREQLWADLAGADGARAYRAIWALAAAPEQTVPLLRERLRLAPAPDAKRLARLIADLDDDEFAVREKATRELEKLGPLARPALRQVLAGRPSAEVRLRAMKLLKKAEQVLPTTEQLRGGRAIEVLEQIGTAAARKALERLARQGPNVLLADDARAALGRLRRRK